MEATIRYQMEMLQFLDQNDLVDKHLIGGNNTLIIIIYLSGKFASL